MSLSVHHWHTGIDEEKQILYKKIDRHSLLEVETDELQHISSFGCY